MEKQPIVYGEVRYGAGRGSRAWKWRDMAIVG